MSSEIKRIDSIKNIAVFHDFQWKVSLRGKGKKRVEFKKINILYGRNYSGKTTLSRIFRSLETGLISDKYEAPEFNLSFCDGAKVNQDLLSGHGQVVRVFNEDFILDNLRFIDDDEQAINSFAILGKDNAYLEAEIEKLEVDLGNEEVKTGLLGILHVADIEFRDAEKAFNDRSSELEEKLRSKANNRETGIKHNKLYGDATYNLPKLKADIEEVSKNGYYSLSPDQESAFHQLLNEEPKSKLLVSDPLNLQFSKLAANTKTLTERKIQISEPIRELLDDSVLENWVRGGRELHQGKRDECAFCGGNLPSDLWVKLDKHFNQESEVLRQELEELIDSIDEERTRVPEILKFNKEDFYSEFAEELDSISEQYSEQTNAYLESLDSLESQIEYRKNNIFSPLEFSEPESLEVTLCAVRDSYEQLKTKSNRFTVSLSTNRAEARRALRLQEVYSFIKDIKYAEEIDAIEVLEKGMNTARDARNSAEENVKDHKKEIRKLKAQLKDESKGAELVNYYLNNFFGHEFLSLRAIEEHPGDTSSGYRFEVTRYGRKAFHLSEGERSLIAFCYFMAKLEDIETRGNQPIIWIDDPISSLDSNHIFFIFSLINSIIVETENYSQLFISTHNLNFLRYLKRISEKTSPEYFLVERNGETSEICMMPEYLKKYVTEFNYLFHRIFRCSTAESTDDSNYSDFYNFGNNARKLLEIYLYYRFPNGEKYDIKLRRFFGEDRIPAILTNRVNNEYSHLAGGIERGASPVEVPEMKRVAQMITLKIQENDPEQYSALLESIGELGELIGETQTVRNDN